MINFCHYTANTLLADPSLSYDDASTERHAHMYTECKKSDFTLMNIGHRGIIIH